MSAIPKRVDCFTKFYNEIFDRGYSKQPLLLGQSQGGLIMLSWLVKNPTKLKAFAGIYSVLNLRSWPMTPNLSTTLADVEMDQDTFFKKG